VANHKSAKKRARQDLKRRARNRQVKSQVRGAVKNCRVLIEGDDSAKAVDALRTAERVLRRAADKGVIPRKQASRRISRLSKANNRQANA
jgi:small subunit ribosomal protein S20